MAPEPESASKLAPAVPAISARGLLFQAFLKVVALQVLLTLCVVLPLWLLGGKLAALSGLLGGGIAVAGSLIYARIALVAGDSVGTVLVAHFGAEVAKVLTVAALFAAVFWFAKWVIVGWLLLAFIVALAAYWIALLVIK